MKLILIVIPAAMLAGCATFSSAPVYGSIPQCERLVPASLKERVPGAPMPVPTKHADGHEQAEPWQVGWLEQTGQLDKANDRPDAIDHIYRTCLQMHRDALEKSKRGFFGRLFG